MSLHLFSSYLLPANMLAIHVIVVKYLWIILSASSRRNTSLSFEDTRLLHPTAYIGQIGLNIFGL